MGAGGRQRRIGFKGKCQNYKVERRKNRKGQETKCKKVEVGLDFILMIFKKFFFKTSRRMHVEERKQSGKQTVVELTLNQSNG